MGKFVVDRCWSAERRKSSNELRGSPPMLQVATAEAEERNNVRSLFCGLAFDDEAEQQRFSSLHFQLIDKDPMFLVVFDYRWSSVALRLNQIHGPGMVGACRFAAQGDELGEFGLHIGTGVVRHFH